jgi:predicted DNA-binding transcriptional regulator AlpA
MAAAADDLTPVLRNAGVITSEEAAAILGCSVHYLRNKVSKLVRPVRIGRGVFWRRSDIEAYKQTHPRIGTNRKSV